jgi:streptogramin lyase
LPPHARTTTAADAAVRCSQLIARYIYVGTSDRGDHRRRTDAIIEFPVTVGAGTHGITAGPGGNVWFTEQSAGKFGRITP